MATVALSSAIVTDTPQQFQNGVTSNGHFSPTRETYHTGATLSSKRLQKPQISIESADNQTDSKTKDSEFNIHQSHSTPGSPRVKKHQSETRKKSLLGVSSLSSAKGKSNSLPLEATLEMFHDEGTLSADDSSAFNSSDSLSLNGENSHSLDFLDKGISVGNDSLKPPPSSPSRRSSRDKLIKMGVLYDDISSEVSSDEESFLSPILVTDPDDEVFREFADIDICKDADSKLFDWAFNVFVPACRTLLFCCADGEDTKESSEQITANLRSLSNSINFFCSEQQRMSVLVHRGMSSSVSTDHFTKIKEKSKTLEAYSDSNSSSGFESQDSQGERTYAVKILRSVSQSLIVPLLQDSESGFTPDLYRSIVQAIQKIAWKVEACLSFSDSEKDSDIYCKIFCEEQKLKLLDMMIQAVPPEEPKLMTSTGRSSRTGSVSDPLKKDSHLEPSRVIRRTPSGRARPFGTVFDCNPLPNDSSDKSSSTEYESRFDPSTNYTLNDLPMNSRRRIATFASTPSPGHSQDTKRFDDEINSSLTETYVAHQNYFRPKHHRRTTISLSKKEVSKLGLVAKRLTTTTESTISTTRESMEPSEEAWSEAAKAQDDINLRMEKLKNRLHDVQNDRFESEFGSTRQRSASAADILNTEDMTSQKSEYQKKKRNYSCQEEGDVPSHMVQKQSSLESPTLNDNLRRCYMPPTSLKKQASAPTGRDVEEEWHYIDPAASLPPISDNTVTKSSRIFKKAKKAKKTSLSVSGRFTSKVIKTAKALRRGSVVSSSKSEKTRFSTSVTTSSMDKLIEDTNDLEGPRPNSSVSEPQSPHSKSETMPTSKRGGKGTLSRMSRSKPKSLSDAASHSLPRKRKSAKFGFLSDSSRAESESGTAALTESIYRLSSNALQPIHHVHSEDQLLLSVESGKFPSKLLKRRSSLISSSHLVWYQITITTNMKQFGRSHYTILRNRKQLVTLHDIISTSCPDCATSLPERPEKKGNVKAQAKQLEEYLRCLAGIPEVRAADPFVKFLMPDDEFGTFAENSEINFELLMTFYTPDMYPGPPGSHNEVQVVAPEDVPSKCTPSPSISRKHSSLQQKRGTLHLMRKEGKEDNSTFVIREEGQDALIVACEDDRYVVVAGTFEKLVEQLACEEKPDPRFVMTFLLGYRHFTSTMELLSLLLARFHMAVAPDATEEEVAYAEKWRYVIQLRVLDIVTYWLKKCWPDFFRNSVVLDRVRMFTDELKASHDTNFQLAGANLEKIITEKLSNSTQYTQSPSKSASPSTSGPPTPLRPLSSVSSNSTASPALLASDLASDSLSSDTRSRTFSRPSLSMDITTISAIQLARQLTLIELEFLRAISTHELVVYIWERDSPANKPYRKNIDEHISRFNKLSYWTSSEICSVSDAKVRGVLIEKFIEVAKHCQEYKNFNSAISIVSGLDLAAVRRLKKSWEYVSEKSVKSFQKMRLIVSPTNNHNAYRKLLSTVHRRDPCIPYFGVFMRDLTLFNHGNKKILKNGLLNFSKLRAMVYKFEELKKYQRSKYFFPPEDKIQEFCRNLWCMSESDLYENSLLLEPREPQPPQLLPEETDI